MSLNRWDPLRDMLSFHERLIGRLESMREEETSRKRPGWNPAADILETPDEYVFMVELPGVGRENINVEVHGDRLTIFGERGLGLDLEHAAYHIIESNHGAFEKQFRLPADANADDAQAHYYDGVLQLRFGKKRGQGTRKVSVVCVG